MAIAGSSGSAANWEKDGREVTPRVITQGPRELTEEPYQQQEPGGVSIKDSDRDWGRCRGIVPPISRVVGFGFAVLPRTNFPGACVVQGSWQRPQRITDGHGQHRWRQRGENTQLQHQQSSGARHPIAATVFIGCLLLGRQEQHEDAQGTNDKM